MSLYFLFASRRRHTRCALVTSSDVCSSDLLLCLGDSIYEYRFSNEVVGVLKERGAHTIQGNHEEVFFSPQGARAREQDWIDQTSLAWLAGRPHRLELTLGGKRILLVHSTPWETRGGYVLPASPALAIGRAAWREKRG